jgi:hypothetical protein
MIKETENLQDIKIKFQSLHPELYNWLSTTIEDVQQNKFSIETITDQAFLCRELETFFQEMTKLVRSRKDLCIKIMGLYLAMQSLENPETVQDKLTGEIAVCRVEPKTMPKIPAKGTPEYGEFLRNLGVPEQLIKSGLICADFKGVMEYVTQLSGEGRKLPNGITQSWTSYVGTFRSKNKKEQ